MIRRPNEATPLQVALCAFQDALLEARKLGAREYLAFVDIAIEVVAREAARCAGWSLDDHEDAA